MIVRLAYGLSVVSWILVPHVLIAAANEMQPDQQRALQYINEEVAPVLGTSELVISELHKTNREREPWRHFDKSWRRWRPDEVEQHRDSYDYAEYLWSARKDRSFRNQLTKSEAAQFLRDFALGTEGIVLELFVTDSHGGNAFQASWTSDWYQGDEAKFKTAAETGQIVIGRPQRDDTVGKVVMQASLPLFDDDSNLLGVAILSLDVAQLP